jgi:hypothetical protein
MVIPGFFIIAKTWQQPNTFQLMNEQMGKWVYIYTVKYNSSINRSEQLIQATAGVMLKGIRVSER